MLFSEVTSNDGLITLGGIIAAQFFILMGSIVTGYFALRNKQIEAALIAREAVVEAKIVAVDAKGAAVAAALEAKAASVLAKATAIEAKAAVVDAKGAVVDAKGAVVDAKGEFGAALKKVDNITEKLDGRLSQLIESKDRERVSAVAAARMEGEKSATPTAPAIPAEGHVEMVVKKMTVDEMQVQAKDLPKP